MIALRVGFSVLHSLCLILWKTYLRYTFCLRHVQNEWNFVFIILFQCIHRNAILNALASSLIGSGYRRSFLYARHPCTKKLHLLEILLRHTTKISHHQQQSANLHRLKTKSWILHPNHLQSHSPEHLSLAKFDMLLDLCCLVRIQLLLSASSTS